MKFEKGNFVTVIGRADLNDGTGQILYVNPASKRLEATPQAKPSEDFELVVHDAAGNVLQRVRPVVRVPASAPTSGRMPPNTHGLIQEDLEHLPGMADVALHYKGQEVARYSAGKSGVASAGPTPSASPSAASAGAAAAEPGVSYTVLVKRDDEQHWHSIAVGKSRPDFKLDRNQFPGAQKVAVKVLRTTGFEQEVLSEEYVALDD